MRHMAGGNVLARRFDIEHRIIEEDVGTERLEERPLRTSAKEQRLVHDLDIRILDAATGEILRQLTLDTSRNYQPTGKPIGGPSRPYGPRKSKRPGP